MTAVHIVLGVALIAVNVAAGAWGTWAWWRAKDAPGFWPMLRVGQALVMIEALDGAILLLAGHDLPELHLVYGLVPLGVSFLAEQLRLAAADTVLTQWGIESREVRGLPQQDQHRLVAQILRRETGVMAASALVVAALGVRASGLL